MLSLQHTLLQSCLRLKDYLDLMRFSSLKLDGFVMFGRYLVAYRRFGSIGIAYTLGIPFLSWLTRLFKGAPDRVQYESRPIIRLGVRRHFCKTPVSVLQIVAAICEKTPHSSRGRVKGYGGHNPIAFRAEHLVPANLTASVDVRNLRIIVLRLRSQREGQSNNCDRVARRTQALINHAYLKFPGQ